MGNLDLAAILWNSQQSKSLFTEQSRLLVNRSNKRDF
jgi:hypothetical protein